MIQTVLLCDSWESREISAVLLTASKTFNVGMHWDIYKLIWL